MPRNFRTQLSCENIITHCDVDTCHSLTDLVARSRRECIRAWRGRSLSRRSSSWWLRGASNASGGAGATGSARGQHRVPAQSRRSRARARQHTRALPLRQRRSTTRARVLVVARAREPRSIPARGNASHPICVAAQRSCCVHIKNLATRPYGLRNSNKKAHRQAAAVCGVTLPIT